jgi:transcriptional regulator with XRE-family HTH domain
MAKKEKNNFRRAVEWLKTNGVVKDQKDMAERMGTTENTISRNKHGGVKRPDDDTLRKFNEQFGSIINIDYLRGESKVMLVKDLAARQSAKQSKPADKTASLIAAKDETIAAKDEAIAALKGKLSSMDETIATLNGRIADKEKIINTQDKLISKLQQQNDDLRQQAASEKGLHSTGVSPLEAADREMAHL